MSDEYANTKYVVEANSYELQTLWQDHHDKVDWKENSSGILATVGHLADMPVCISVRWIQLNGIEVMIYHPTSQVVDHRMIEKWLDENCNPMDNDRRARTDANNFHQVLHMVNK